MISSMYIRVIYTCIVQCTELSVKCMTKIVYTYSELSLSGRSSILSDVVFHSYLSLLNVFVFSFQNPSFRNAVRDPVKTLDTVLH